jgi:magnesium transporter
LLQLLSLEPLVTDLDAGVSGAELVEPAGSGPLTDVDDLVRRVEARKFFWLDLSAPSPSLITKLTAVLQLTEDAGRYLLSRDQRSEFDVSYGEIRVIAYGMQDERQLVEVHAVYTGSLLITVHDASCSPLGEARNLYQQLRHRRRGDAPLVLFMVLDALAASFQPVLGRLDARLDELEAMALGGALAPDYLQQIVEIRRVLAPIMRALAPYRSDLAGVFGAIHRLPGMGAGALVYFESHRNHVAAIYEYAKDCRDETRDALQVYSSATADRQGYVINWLTVLAAIFAPLTVVTAYFGMNFSVISGLRGWPVFIELGVVLPVLLVIVSVVVVTRLIRRLGVTLLTTTRPPASGRRVQTADRGEVET